MATPPRATAPATSASTRVALGFQFMLPVSERKLFDQQCHDAGDVVQV
jgi:hypothetical protein